MVGDNVTAVRQELPEGVVAVGVLLCLLLERGNREEKLEGALLPAMSVRRHLHRRLPCTPPSSSSNPSKHSTNTLHVTLPPKRL